MASSTCEAPGKQSVRNLIPALLLAMGMAACGPAPATFSGPTTHRGASVPPSDSAAAATLATNAGSPPQVVAGSCEPAIANSLASVYRGMLRADSGPRVRLARDPWPPAEYCVVRVTPSVTGQLTVLYRFERVRADDPTPEIVERAFPIEVLARGTTRKLTLGFPYRFPVVLGDSVDIPVPMGDPWGRFQGFTWLPGEQTLQGVSPFALDPCRDPAASPPPSTWSPQLRWVRDGCHDVLLANLQTRSERWQHYRAEAAGPVAGTALEVVPSTEPIVMPIRVWHERTQSRSTSTMTQVDQHAVVLLRVGDAVWMRPRQ